MGFTKQQKSETIKGPYGSNAIRKLFADFCIFLESVYQGNMGRISKSLITTRPRRWITKTLKTSFDQLEGRIFLKIRETKENGPMRGEGIFFNCFLNRTSFEHFFFCILQMNLILFSNLFFKCILSGAIFFLLFVIPSGEEPYLSYGWV